VSTLNNADSSRCVTILGLGGAGGRIVNRLHKLLGQQNIRIAAADTDVIALNSLDGAAQVILGSEWPCRTGCGGDVSLGERAASASAAGLLEAMRGSELLLSVVGFGGGTGTGAAKVAARIARGGDITSIFIVTEPFAFEGNWRRQQAADNLAALRNLADAVIVVPNDLLFHNLQADTPAAQAFELSDSVLAEGVAGLSWMVSGNCLLPIDFAAIRTLLKRRSAICTLGVGKAEGKNRWQHAADQFLACPLIGGREKLATADAAVLTVRSGADLSVGEIQSCMSGFQQLFQPQARILVGAYTDVEAGNLLEITGLICHYQKNEFDADASAEATPTKRGKGKRGKAAASSSRQDELPFQELITGMFSNCTPTTVGGQNLDVPTFQRRGICLDLND